MTILSAVTNLSDHKKKKELAEFERMLNQQPDNLFVPKDGDGTKKPRASCRFDAIAKGKIVAVQF